MTSPPMFPEPEDVDAGVEAGEPDDEQAANEAARAIAVTATRIRESFTAPVCQRDPVAPRMTTSSSPVDNP